MREAIFHSYRYPNLKSRIKTLFLKLTRIYAGETWIPVLATKLGKENMPWLKQLRSGVYIQNKNCTATFTLEILKGEWCGQEEILIIRELQWNQ